MGLDYAPSLDRHDARRKVGVITRAEIVGRNLELGGYLFAKDFPEIVREIGKSGSGFRDLAVSGVIRRHTGIRGSSCPNGRNCNAHQMHTRVHEEMQRRKDEEEITQQLMTT